MDNLGVHTCPDSTKLHARLKIPTIFNVAYSPELNPIELCFSMIKRRFYN